MNVLNLLSQSQNFIEFSVESIKVGGVNWLVSIVGWIFNLFKTVPGGVGIGAIVFTLLLKTIVLPLDIYSRVKMKKQSLLMEEMRPQMEKLQKQYANDKTMYSQKVMELQKSHGVNPLGACLPTIVTIVIFMIVFSAFNTFSHSALLTTYNGMVDAYNQSVETYVYTSYEKDADGNAVLDENGELKYVDKNADGFLKEDKVGSSSGFIVDYDRFEAAFAKYSETADGEVKEELDRINALYLKGKQKRENGTAGAEADMNEAVINFVQLNARDAAANYYRTERVAEKFLWIGNLWFPDSMLNKEVPDFKKFQSSITRAVGSTISSTYEESYEEVTKNLVKEKNTYNGYFVFVVLSIGLMFLQQFITMRSQKAANELSSVDGSAARTNKWMMILMPVIFGAFAFMYTAALSIYMIVNTTYSLISTLVINKIVSVRFEKHGIKKVSDGRPERKRLK